MNNTITILDVSGNQLGGEGLKQLVRMLEENVSIIDLVSHALLQHNKVSKTNLMITKIIHVCSYSYISLTIVQNNLYSPPSNFSL
jgi:hypothetical protein